MADRRLLEDRTAAVIIARMTGKHMLQEPPPVLVVDLFPEILESLIALLSGFTPGDWARPTVCAGWSVKDVALHLLGIEVGNLSRRRDGQVSSERPAQNWNELVGVIKDWNETWVESTRRISAPLLIDLLDHSGRQWCEFGRKLNPFAPGGAVSWAGPEPAPVWLDLAREYTERWHHQQHIRDAVGRPGLKQPRYLAPALATFSRGLPHAFEKAAAVEGTTITLEISGESGGRWTIERTNEAWKLYAGAPERATARAALDEDTAWRLFTRGISPAQAKSRVKLGGNLTLAQQILETVSIIA
jgi:uncharacterized protein (TIGR03083 family)